jgi:hypothetical protein
MTEMHWRELTGAEAPWERMTNTAAKGAYIAVAAGPSARTILTRQMAKRRRSPGPIPSEPQPSSCGMRLSGRFWDVMAYWTLAAHPNNERILDAVLEQDEE